MKIYTSYYANIRNFSKEEVVPISISLGVPKFLKAPMLRLMMLAPTRDMLGLDYEIYKAKYIEILKRVDWRLVQEIIKDNSKGQPVALCCYEALRVEGEWCHRTMLSEYLNSNQKALFGEVTEYKKKELKKESSNQTNMFN